VKRYLERVWIRYIEGYWRRRGVLPPTNYNGNYNLLLWAACEAPLARRGIYFPQKTSGAFRTFFDEHEYIDRLMPTPSAENRFFVDLGASDGIEINNVYQLCTRGWSGLSVEADSARFARLAVTYARFPSVFLSRARITPENVVALLKSALCPREFAVLDLDLDSYDYFVLEAILDQYRPSLIVTEINPMFPPPIKFTLLVGDEPSSQADWFYGMSVSQLDALAAQAGYNIVDLNGYAAFLMPSELDPQPRRLAAELFETGYRSRYPDAAQPPPQLRGLSDLQPNEAVKRINQYFADRDGRYTCSV
jgi:hypothetical protein